MALFAGQPAGIQIKKWLIILVSLIVFINILAAVTLILLQRSVTDIQAKYQPVLIAAIEINSRVYRTQVSLYKYLGEYLPTTEEIDTQTDLLEKTLDEALSLEGVDSWREELESIREGLAKYRVVVANLPAIGGKTDWAQLDEFRSQAVSLGQSMEEDASKLKTEVGTRIDEKARRSLSVSRTAVVIFLVLIGLSAGITLLLLAWWRQFQEMILSL